MEVIVRMATTGNIVYTSEYSTVNDLRIWELRLHLCQALSSTEYFCWTLFHDYELTDDTSPVSAYRGETSDVTILFHAVKRELRPPTDEERWAIIDFVAVRHRSHLWNMMSRGIHMTSTLLRGTARDSSLVRAITTDYPPTFDEGPLPDIATTLLLAMCDPNNQGAPPRSPLEAAI